MLLYTPSQLFLYKSCSTQSVVAIHEIATLQTGCLTCFLCNTINRSYFFFPSQPAFLVRCLLTYVSRNCTSQATRLDIDQLQRDTVNTASTPATGADRSQRRRLHRRRVPAAAWRWTAAAKGVSCVAELRGWVFGCLHERVGDVEREIKEDLGIEMRGDRK